ncbi:MAG: hypothetical protein LBP52_02405 [Burkholderiaceae bacterium]|jgi:hypothetical protein|nr:hypothetical protein [Burkholderiaceae bacterium]
MSNRISLVLAALIASIAAVGCGGGGSIGDGTLPLEATPGKILVKSAGCSASGFAGPRIMVYGGVEPYTIHNPWPEQIQLSTTYLEDAGDSFEVSLTGGMCLDAIELTIIDSDANVQTVTISHINSIGN